MTKIKNKELLIIITIYVFLTIYLIINNNILYINIINPIFWLFLIFYLFWYKKNNYIIVKRKYIKYITMISIFNIIFYFYTGFIFGFSKNPYSRDLLQILKNIIIQIIPLSGIELFRGFLVTQNKGNKLLIVYTTIMLILIEINYSAIFNLSDKESLFQYICDTIIPLISTNILCTYLSKIDSYVSSIIFIISYFANFKLVCIWIY